MNPAIWRVFALVCIAGAITFACYQVKVPAQQDFGMRLSQPALASTHDQVLSVEHGSPAAHAGVRAGDRIAYLPSPLDRAAAVYARAGSRASVTVNDSRTVTMTAVEVRSTDIPLVVTAVRLAFLLIAALLAWRRPEDRSARFLVCFLWAYGLAIALASGTLSTPLLSLIVLQIGPPVLFVAGAAAATKFASTFPFGEELRVSRILSNIAVALFVVNSLGVFIVNLYTAVPAAVRRAFNVWYFASFGIIVLVLVAVLTISYVNGEPSDRQRRRWIFLILGLGIASLIVDALLQSTFGYREWLDELTILPLALIPIGLAYTILRHRVIDVGFVLNRAIVYAGVSGVIVAVFVIVETLLAKYVEQTNHVGSVTVQLAVALILGFSVRAIHTRVDRIVDAVLFRERHVAESAIRTFAHDASYITDSGTLLARCVEIVERYGKANGAGVWVAESSLYRARASSFSDPRDAGENDPAVVAMRARRVIVDLHEGETALPGTLAFPMVVRGELVGILVCGSRTDDETYAPDERDALSGLASSVGHALDAIEVRELRARLEQLTTLR